MEHLWFDRVHLAVRCPGTPRLLLPLLLEVVKVVPGLFLEVAHDTEFVLDVLIWSQLTPLGAVNQVF